MNGYFREFPKLNGPDEDKIKNEDSLGILEHRIPKACCQEMTIQGFDLMIEGMRKFVDFYSSMEFCELEIYKREPKKVSF